jgi:hypothetical protein
VKSKVSLLAELELTSAQSSAKTQQASFVRASTPAETANQSTQPETLAQQFEIT